MNLASDSCNLALFVAEDLDLAEMQDSIGELVHFGKDVQVVKGSSFFAVWQVLDA